MPPEVVKSPPQVMVLLLGARVPVLVMLPLTVRFAVPLVVCVSIPAFARFPATVSVAPEAMVRSPPEAVVSDPMAVLTLSNGLFVVPGMETVQSNPGTTPPCQLVAVAQSVLVAPVQV